MAKSPAWQRKEGKSPTGGVAGTWIQIVAIAANKYMVNGLLNGTGSVATPFADS